MYRQMPLYNRDQDAFIKQMHAWHIQMANYEGQLKAFHEERAKQFRELFADRQGVVASNGTI
jgi:hypothetical protein